METKNRDIITTIEELMDITIVSETISEMFIAGMDYTREYRPVITDKDDEAMAMIEHLNNCWELDMEDEENKHYFMMLIDSCLKRLDEKEYLNNPYYQTIKVSTIKQGDYKLFMDNYLSYEIFAYNDIKVDKNYYEHCSIGYFKKNFPFLALTNRGTTWMSITPNEINTMQPAIDEVKGNVLVMGLGLGYFPFMASIKGDVNRIVIIEEDQTIIDLFEDYLLPQFPHQEKITIVKDNALKIKPDFINAFDYCFVDLWHDPVDGLPFYQYFKKLEKDIKTKMLYWLEASFYAYMRRIAINVIYDKINIPDNWYENKEENKMLIEFNKKIDLSKFTTREQIYELIKDENLLKLLIS